MVIMVCRGLYWNQIECHRIQLTTLHNQYKGKLYRRNIHNESIMYQKWIYLYRSISNILINFKITQKTWKSLKKKNRILVSSNLFPCKILSENVPLNHHIWSLRQYSWSLHPKRCCILEAKLDNRLISPILFVKCDKNTTSQIWQKYPSHY